uniref:STEEP1 domain-containing protein n=1 Tax=Chromera velia CCMP2878 TaxID=1169474 RepID=A0A0G4I5P2_9ALVE|mmetsp:Transcript_2531/g.5277  ORF Transcript_2531/g.5277 Transcript_2531/m.5277 type:complete len:214 (-) Transcript_2531:317-958(-)|eukprot:Cvel_1861.t1-p1 / transcript=Cvel_1861.t1 / gene=Cvel_1861 / organism=Chromera_velia_CCMP2878 / gene_product=UPF0428 protein CXorf56 homolog, putative / transcript_product=UPF0428 protein CXorf56 homolog, putative / location=Cvel_scaffold69:39069-41408(-) / protein_length=213 / sequence_SO=supercontig / SO=protein_coding / is_pseudo=false
MAIWRYGDFRDAEYLHEYGRKLLEQRAASRQAAAAAQPGLLPAPGGQQSLAEIRRKAKTAEEEKRENMSYGKVKILNYTSEDSNAAAHERQLHRYFCSICGSLCAISDADFSALPRRATDGACALKEDEYFLKRYAKVGGRPMWIRREGGFEEQWRITCNDCGLAIGYRQAAEEDESKCSFFFQGAYVTETSRAVQFAPLGVVMSSSFYTEKD